MNRLYAKKAQEQADLFVAGAQTLFKHVKLKAEPAMMLRWDKNAEACYNADGELQIWTPDIVTKKKDVEQIKEGSWAGEWRETYSRNGELYGLQPLQTTREIAAMITN